MKRQNKGGLLILLIFFLAGVLHHIQAQEELPLAESLSATTLDIGIMLKWQDTLGHAAEAYIVEKSRDGLSFEAIGDTNIVPGQSEYRYLDVLARSNPLFYRISIYEPNGEIYQSDVVRIDNSHTNNYLVSRISDVKTAGLFSIDIESFTEGDLDYAVRNLSGETYTEGSMVMVPGTNQLTVDISGAIPDIYRLFLKMKDEEEVLTFERIDQKKSQVASDTDLSKD